jgi:cell division protein FtsI (penicillin-binding protein 3)
MTGKEHTQRLEGATKQAIETGRTRLLVAGAIFALAFSTISVRLADITVLQQGHEPRVAQAARVNNVSTMRADIVDRNGELLATSLQTASLYANPKHVINPAEAAGKLVSVLPGLSQAELQAKLAASNRSFVWIHRHLTPRQQYDVNKLGIPGVYFQRDERRVYPQGPLAAHVVGFTNIDGEGLAGIEKSFDEVLKGGGRPLALSLDIRVQHVLRQELQNTVKKFSAIGAAGIMLDVNTGEVIAMVSLPDFDPHNPTGLDSQTLFNRATLGVYEQGSMFKIFTAAMALDSGAVNMASSFDASKPIHIARFTISDYHGQNRWLSLPEVLIYSSNIGAAKMALAAGTAVQRKYLGAFGMLRPASIELPEIGAPMVPSPWREINTMTIGFGHGLAVSPLQMVDGVAAVANGGRLLPTTLLKRVPGEKPEGTRVITPRTAEEVRKIMRLVVTEGSGKSANVPGYFVGGKTGTAEKVNEHGGYKRKALLSSFIAAFPINQPRYVVLASIDEPHGIKESYGYATGGWTAAPAVGRIISRVAPILGIQPEDDSDGRIAAKLAINSMARGRTVASQ